ncbi:MAG: BACON domain-containing protein, partial [Desulfobacterales bacterium]
GTGDGTVGYSVSANTGPSSRTATITVAGQSHTVTQTPPSQPPPICTYSISPTSRTFPSGGGNDTISVDAVRDDCQWTASASVDWITINSGSSGTGDGTVGYSVSANTGTSSRTATITVAGQSHTVTQEPLPSCTSSISPASRNFPSSGGNGTITVDALRDDCQWTASESVGWITITSGSSGTGDGTVAYSVAANTGTSSRTATITAAGQSHTVTQEAPFLLTIHGGGEGTGTVTSSPSGINCSINGTIESGVCSTAFSSGSQVSLFADPTGGSTFTGWSGGGCSGTSPCNVTMDQGQTVTANFAHALAPTIDNISQELVALNTGRCADWSGVIYTGTIFGISFDYTDPDGDAHEDGGAKVDMGFDITPWSHFTGNGFEGSVTANRCLAFGDDTSRTVTAKLIDSAGHDSNSLTISIPKPNGYDQCFTQEVEADVQDDDVSDTRLIDLRRTTGTFQFDYDTFSGEDRIVVRYQNVVLFDTGCVENSDTVFLTYSGTSTQITVEVEPNCFGSNDTSWNYKVHCP